MGSMFIAFIVLFPALLYGLHKWLLPLLIKNYGGIRQREKRYHKDINKINKKTKL